MGERPKNIALLTAFESGYEMLRFALETDSSKIKLVATSEKDDSPYESKIASFCEKKNIKLYRKVNVNASSFIQDIKMNKIDLGILLWWPSILKQEVISSLSIGWVNNHPSYLPYSRGKHGYYWTITEKEPFGVSIHLIDEGIDSGPILFQRKIEVAIEDTGETLYEKSRLEMISLFKDSYIKLVRGDFHPSPQNVEEGSFHRKDDIESHSKIDLAKSYKAMDLINIIRGRTFEKGNSSYFILDGKKYFVKLRLEKA